MKDLDLAPFVGLPFYAYLVHAQERGARAVTLTEADFRALAARLGELSLFVQSSALTAQDFNEFYGPQPLDISAQLDKILATIDDRKRLF